MAELVAIGKISGAVGLKGEMRIVRWADSSERFRILRNVWVGPDGVDVQEFAVERVRNQGRDTILKLAGIENRSGAETLRGHVLLIPVDEVVRPPEGSFFIDDVLGMSVVTEEGKRVGTVREVLRLPQNDLWQVDTGSKLVSIPAVQEFIRKVDVATKTVVIHEVEGLLDV